MKQVPNDKTGGEDSILVAGSAGFIGKALIRKLSDAGRAMNCLYHAHLPDPVPHMTPTFADMMRREHIISTLAGVGTVVHLAWSQSFRARWEEAFWAQEGVRQDGRNIAMVKNLVSAMEEAGTRRIIFVSALGASRTAESWYLQEKYFAEALILNSKIPEKIILRSSLAYADLGAKDRLVAAIERLMRFPWFYPVPKCQEKLAPIHVSDLAEIIYRLIDIAIMEPANLIEVSGLEALDIEDVFRFVSVGIGKGAHIALKGLLGQALTPLFEQMQKRRSETSPDLRDLLTVGNSRDKAVEIDNPILKDLPSGTHRFQETMVSKAH